MTWTLNSEDPDSEVREIVRLYDALHGVKRGRALLAMRAGITERRLKTLIFENGRLYADELVGFLKARQAGRRERATRLRSELQQIEREEARHAGADVEALPSGLRMAG